MDLHFFLPQLQLEMAFSTTAAPAAAEEPDDAPYQIIEGVVFFSRGATLLLVKLSTHTSFIQKADN